MAADKLKESGTNNWQKPVSQSANESGFTAIPGGYRSENGYFYVLGYNGWWWQLIVCLLLLFRKHAR